MSKKKSKKTKTDNKGKKGLIKFLMSGDYLASEQLIKQLPFIAWITFLMILYIAKNYQIDKTLYEIGKVKNQNEALKTKSIVLNARKIATMNLDYCYQELSKDGLKPSDQPPIKIFDNSKGNNVNNKKIKKDAKR
jgi:hypothetical protein